MVQKIAENVDLIKTIPERMHAGLKLRMEEALGTAPFDQQQLTGVLRDEYKSSGYNSATDYAGPNQQDRGQPHTDSAATAWRRAVRMGD